jgi:hypothetical protein
MSGKIFICYRREDTRWSARSVNDRLTTHFDQKQVFMDIEGIGLGKDFVKEIENSVGECDVLVAVIGMHWLTSKDEQGRRLDNPEDFVRMEIATALKRDVLVIPVLVDGAPMPRSADLPDNLKALVRRNALRLSEAGFNDDCRRLIAAIEQVLEKSAAHQRDRLNPERREIERPKAEARQREEEGPKAEQIQKESVQNASFYNARGVDFYEKKEYDKAIGEYDKAIRLDRNFALAYNNRGIAYYAKKEYEKAMSDCNEAIRLDPRNARKYYIRTNDY